MLLSNGLTFEVARTFQELLRACEDAARSAPAADKIITRADLAPVEPQAPVPAAVGGVNDDAKIAQDTMRAMSYADVYGHGREARHVAILDTVLGVRILEAHRADGTPCLAAWTAIIRVVCTGDGLFDADALEQSDAVGRALRAAEAPPLYATFS